jgi:protease-4
MRAFFKYFLASFAAMFLAAIFLFIIGSRMIGSFISSLTEEQQPRVESGTLLVLKLDGEITERANEDPFAALFADGEPDELPLNTTLRALKAAKKDDRIKGLYLHCDLLSAGMGHAEALRNAVLDFKASGKFVWAYGDSYTERAWYIASVADSIFLQPTGMMEWNGLASSPIFLKGSLEKLYITPQVFRVGEFKSAGEMFDRTSLSAENRAQTQAFVDDLWQHIVGQAAKSRKLDAATLTRLAGDLEITHATHALQHKLVDALLHKDQLRERLKRKVETNEKGELKQITTGMYAKLTPKDHKHHDAQIAVVYANGGIMGGKGDATTIGSDGMARTLRKLREDDNVKAVVFRVNSTGGSALASDIIAREMQLLRKAKPVVVSMGDVAASGGYYISAHANRIFAEPTTLTGSIGVIGLWLNTQQFFNRHLGITFDEVHSTGTPHANMLNPTKALHEKEAAVIQRQITQVYKEFIEVVQTGRGYPSFAAVDSLARGRVYSGITALKLKLVDELGGMPEAMAHAAKLAGLAEDAYSVAEYPTVVSPLEKVVASLSGKETWAPMHQMLQAVIGVENRNFLLRLLLQHRTQPLGIYTHMGNIYTLQ